MYEQDKFDEGSQIEAVTIQDAGTEDEDVTNDNNVWRLIDKILRIVIVILFVELKWILVPKFSSSTYISFSELMQWHFQWMKWLVMLVSEIHMHGEIGETWSMKQEWADSLRLQVNIILPVQWFPLLRF